MSRSPLLTLRHIGFGFGGQPAIASNWSTTIGPGVTLVHGDTGSGKTALLRVLAGEAHGSGDRIIDGVDAGLDIEAYRRQVFFIDPWTDRFDEMTPHDCALALSAGGTIDEADWRALAQAFSLEPHLGKKLFMLSTGSKRKVYLAAALVSRRPLVLLDEPTAALDAPSIATLWQALAHAGAQGDRIIVVASAERVDQVAWTGVIDLPLP